MSEINHIHLYDLAPNCQPKHCLLHIAMTSVSNSFIQISSQKQDSVLYKILSPNLERFHHYSQQRTMIKLHFSRMAIYMQANKISPQ